MKQLQPKNNRMIPRYYGEKIDREDVPPPDCPSWALSAEARELYNIPDPDFDPELLSGQEDSRKKRKGKVGIGTRNEREVIRLRQKLKNEQVKQV